MGRRRNDTLTGMTATRIRRCRLPGSCRRHGRARSAAGTSARAGQAGELLAARLRGSARLSAGVPRPPGTLAVARAAAVEVLGLPRHRLPRLACSDRAPPGRASVRSSTTEAAPAARQNFSGRVAALAISPACRIDGGCRVWVGTAGGGVWRTEDAMHHRRSRRGAGSARASAPTTSAASRSIPTTRRGDTIYVGTGETNSPQNSGAGTGLYRSTDGGDHWTRVSTNILDPTVSPHADRLHLHARHQHAWSSSPATRGRSTSATTSAMLGMTGVRGGQSQTTGYPQPRVGLYKTVNGGDDLDAALGAAARSGRSRQSHIGRRRGRHDDRRAPA